MAVARTDSIDVAVDAARDVLACTPSALVTDIDGTLSRIVARPEDATVEGPIRECLRALLPRLALVAVVTGREEVVARAMVGVQELVYVGNYALEGITAVRLDSEDLAGAKQRVKQLMQRFPCVEIEEKGVSFAMHFRNCADGAMRERILSLVDPVATVHGGRILEGKQVVEMVPASLPNKDTAVAHLLTQKQITGTVYLGDDVSDVPVYREIRRRRANGLPGVGIAVVDAETHPSVLENSDIRLDGVDAIRSFLQRLARMDSGGES